VEEESAAEKEERTENHETFPYIQSKIYHNSETNPMKKLDSIFLKRRE